LGEPGERISCYYLTDIDVTLSYRKEGVPNIIRCDWNAAFRIPAEAAVLPNQMNYLVVSLEL
jgi:hypothetical protein